MQNLEGWQNTLLGAMAGPFSMPVYQPFIYWKNSYAILGQPFTVNPKFVYRGLPVSMVLQGPVNGTQFLGVGWAKQAMGGKSDETASTLSDSQKAFAGFCGGNLSGLVCAPQELIMVQQQKQGGTLASTAVRIVKEYGPQRLFRALPATSLREGFYTMGFLSIAGIAGDWVRKSDGFNPNSPQDQFKARMGGAIIGGCTGALISHPIDFIKTNQQSDVDKIKFRGFLQTGSVLYQELGITAFYKGAAWRCSGIIVASFMINWWKDQLAPICFPSAFAEKQAK